MFNQNGLSLDQAPPLSVVLRFFFLGALFGIISGITLLFFKTDIFDSSSIAALTFTHLLTLGVMLSFMFAALFQMLPVIAGIRLTSPIKKSNLLLYPFVLGVVSLLLAFNTSIPWLYLLAVILIVLSLVITVIPMLHALCKLQSHSSSSKGMAYALLSLLFVISLAVYLVLTLSGTIESHIYFEVKTAHYSFGLFGWIALLIISISFQVIEMFYVTPPYPNFVRRYLAPSLFVVLFTTTIMALFISELWTMVHILLAFILGAYALLTLYRLTQKKRPLSDATVWFWRIGLSSLLLSMLSMLITKVTTLPHVEPLSYIFFANFALSIVFAMFYKIVPFLTWFHLSSQGYFTAPMMHEIIHPARAKKHLYIHIAMVLSFVLSLFIPMVIMLSAGLMIISFGWIMYHIIHAHLLYKKTQATGEKFEMGNMG